VLSVEGRDVRALPLVRRKHLLRSVMPTVESRLRYLDAVRAVGLPELAGLVTQKDETDSGNER
jgi:hypothetical protein